MGDFRRSGGWVAEELDAVPLSELLTGESRLNFGWGRSPIDGKSREGRFESTRWEIPARRYRPASRVRRARGGGRTRSHEAFAVSGPVQSRRRFRESRFSWRSGQRPDVRDDWPAIDEAAGSAPRRGRRQRQSVRDVEELDGERATPIRASSTSLTAPRACCSSAPASSIAFRKCADPGPLGRTSSTE